MARAERLISLMALLRSHRYPVSGEALAGRLGISVRTLYRDIDSLRAQGADIDGEAGMGYLLRPGFTLPPLMFTVEEAEALALGTRWVAKRGGDDRLAAAARSALDKIAAVVPQATRDVIDDAALMVGAGSPDAAADGPIPEIRHAIRAERVVELRYRDAKGAPSQRRVWPFALGYFDQVRVFAAWCETRRDFRHFRTDRVEALIITEERYPRRRQALIKAWRAAEGIEVTCGMAEPS